MPSKHLSLIALLYDKGLLTKQDHTEALRSQILFGGRLGTNLVEQGHTSLDDLGNMLALQYGVQSANTDAFLSVTSSTLALVDPRFCVKHHIIPLWYDGQLLHLAMSDPSPAKTVHLSKHLGFRIRPYVAPELRLLHYLERYYNVDRPSRYLRLPDGGEAAHKRRHYLHATTHLPLSPTISLAPLKEDTIGLFFPADAGFGDPPLEQPPETLIEFSREETIVDRLPGRPGEDSFLSMDTRAFEALPMSESSTFQAVLRQLDASTTRDDITHCLIQPLFRETSTNILLMVRDNFAIVMRSSGLKVRSGWAPELVVALDEPTLIRQAVLGGDIVQDDAQHAPLQRKIAQRLGYCPPGEICIAPISLEGKVRFVLCLHSGQGVPFPDTIVPDLRLLMKRAARAFQRLQHTIISSLRIAY